MRRAFTSPLIQRLLPILLDVVPLAAGAGAAGAQGIVELPEDDAPLELTVESVYTVGGWDGEEWAAFGGSVEVAFDGEGNLLVFDVDNHRIVRISPTGALINQFGRAGGGPGEFRAPRGFTVSRDGRVLVSDLGAQALHLFTVEGDFLRSVRMSLMDGIPGQGIAFTPHPGIVVAPPSGARIRMGEGAGDPPPPQVERMDISGEAVDREGIFEPFQPPPPPLVEGGGGSFQTAGGGTIELRGMPAERAFEPKLHMTVLPDGTLVLADSTTWTLELLTAEGETVARLARPIPPRAVTPRMEAQEKRRRLEAFESGPSSVRVMMTGPTGASGSTSQDEGLQAMLRQRLENMVFWPEIPVIQALRSDWEGVIWVGRAGETPGASGLVDLVRRDGAYLGTLAPGAPRVPDAFGPGGLAAFIETDDFDVVRVEVKRITD